MTPLSPLFQDFDARIAGADAEELETIEHELFGRKNGLLTTALKELSNLNPSDMRERGRMLNATKQSLLSAMDIRRKILGSGSVSTLAAEDPIDVSLDLPVRERGHLHLIPEFIRSVEDVFGRMGFSLAEGPEIDTEENNFDLLNFPKDHAARDAQDIFYVNLETQGGGKKLLRGHTSTVQIRYMKTHKPPFSVICPGKVYRKDADATHSPMFHQFDGLMIGEGISLANMKAIMEEAVRALISPNVEFRFRTGYFPFVEPGLEMDLRWQGTSLTSNVPGVSEHPKEGKWLEVAGCGMTHPSVLKNCGIDPKRWQGFAFGFGVERMLMIKHQIPDLRSFYEGDLRFLRQF